jgi:hypothetical protein
MDLLNLISLSLITVVTNVLQYQNWIFLGFWQQLNTLAIYSYLANMKRFFDGTNGTQAQFLVGTILLLTSSLIAVSWLSFQYIHILEIVCRRVSSPWNSLCFHKTLITSLFLIWCYINIFDVHETMMKYHWWDSPNTPILYLNFLGTCGTILHALGLWKVVLHWS